MIMAFIPVCSHRRSRVPSGLSPPVVVLVLVLLATRTMTGNAFPVTFGRQQSLVSLVLQSQLQEHTGDHEDNSSFGAPREEKPIAPRVLMKTTASVVTGTFLALSLCFAPTTTMTTDAPAFFLLPQPALAAKTATTEPPAAIPQQEAQLKSAKAALAEASQRLKAADSKVKQLEAALKKTEQNIGVSEKAVQKSKEALKQAESRYRELQKQKKSPKVLDKESQKVVSAKLGFDLAIDDLASNKGKKYDLKTQTKTAVDELKAAQKREQQAAAQLSTAENNYATYQKKVQEAKKAAEAKAQAKLALEQEKAREKAALESLAAAKAQKRLEGKKQQILTQTKDLQAELKNLQEKRKKVSDPQVIDAQIATVQQKLDALKQTSKELNSTKK